MTFFGAVATVLQKYVVFSGRAQRAEYWYWTLFAVIVSICTSILDAVMFPAHEWSPLNTVFSIATLLPALAVGVRRLHDVDRSAWWLLLWFVPVVGWIVLLVWATKRGSSGDNRFGPDPLAGQAQAQAQAPAPAPSAPAAPPPPPPPPPAPPPVG